MHMFILGLLLFPAFLFVRSVREATLAALALLAVAPQAAGQGASTWFLAEGANNATFAQEILVGNPSAQPLRVTVTLLPQSDAIAPTLSKTFDLRASARLTVRLGSDFNLNGSASARVSAVLASDNATPADVVVERTMYFPGDAQPGSHNASGVTQSSLSGRWILAEGSGGVFETFVLVANPNTTPTTVRATYLTATGQSFITEQIAPANSRLTFYPRGEHAPLAAADFSTVIESLTSGNLVIAERAMYFDNFRSGHDALGVTGPSTTWLFAEGFTGGNAQTAFETFLLLANAGDADTVATVDYLLDNGEVVRRSYPLGPRSRLTVWVDQEGRTVDERLRAAAFGIRVTAASPIVAERAMYWGTPSATDPTMPTFPWREGHATAGTLSGEPRWAFAEGQQGAFGAAAIAFDTFFLLANPQNIPVLVRATFVREDGRGIVRTVCVAPNSRNNIWTASFPELAGQRFATFFESISSADPSCAAVANTGFVVERAVYSGTGFLAGHVNVGRRWSGSIAIPPVAPVPAPPTYALTVNRGTGTAGTPASTATYNQGTSVSYSYSLQVGYQNLVVTLDGTPVAASGSVTMNAAHTLAVSATPSAPIQFGPGTHLVNSDIAAGRYFSVPTYGCYWERLSGLGGTLNEIIANEFVSFNAGQWIVDIQGTDRAFSTDSDCGTWFSSPRQGAQSIIKPGVWLVGTQIAPGTYRTTASSGCYWERLRNFGGTLSAIIANDYISGGGSVIVTISGGDVGFSSDSDCGEWTKVQGLTTQQLNDQPVQSPSHVERNWLVNRQAKPSR